ncbi:MAG: hypothetical protein H7X99_11020 [Saprospiraceae bacterium]|nr:hypothetical protein [Saprospiraceae bacterium]
MDNLHACSNDLLAFLKNLFLRLKDLGIPTLCLTISNREERNLSPENQWIKYFESITRSNKFRILTMPPLENNDAKIYLRALVPGATKNLIDLIERNVFVNPFHIKLFVEYLKSKGILKSADGKFWLLQDPSVLLDSQHLRVNTLDNLVIHLLEIKLRNPQFRNAASLIFFFNNSIDSKVLKEVLATADEFPIFESGLFHGVYGEDSMVIQFSHDLFYYNLPLALKREVLVLYASQLLDILKNADVSLKISRTDVLGKLYEYIGKYNYACDNYLLYAREKFEFSGFTSLLFYEKAIEMHLSSNESQRSLLPGTENLTAEIIFQTLILYDRYNFLSGRKSMEFFQLLQKFSDFGQLSSEQELKHMYFLGLQSTKLEDFKAAEDFLKKAYETISNTEHFPENLIGDIIGCYGINLKHLGRKDESMDFFETASRRWHSPQILYQKYSNIAAYYLTVDPAISLKKYEDMERQIAPLKDLHLLIDFAMANFYLRKPDSSFGYLTEAITLSRKQVNLSEEARAENIMGLLYWQKSNIIAAEHYFDLALSNGELANNHRWIWRIRTNLTQVALYNQNTAKSYNTGWAVAEHLLKTKDALVYEARNKKIQSRRFAALKAIAVVFYKMELYNDLKKLEQMFHFENFSNYLQDLYAAKGDMSFDSKDQNLFQKDYFILG